MKGVPRLVAPESQCRTALVASAELAGFKDQPVCPSLCLLLPADVAAPGFFLWPPLVTSGYGCPVPCAPPRSSSLLSPVSCDPGRATPAGAGPRS